MKTPPYAPIAIALLIAGTPGLCAENSPEQILQNVAAAYRNLDTYQSEGTIVSSIDTGGMKVSTKTSFSIRLKKPNQYLISWSQENQLMPGMTQSGAVWNTGEQPYLFMGMMNAYAKMASHEVALGGATGISGGAAFTIPSLFLATYDKHPSPFSRLKEPALESDQTIEGDVCYVLSAPSTVSRKETFWISKQSHLIRKYERSLEPPEGGTVVPEMTDEQLKEAIKGMGQEVTEASLKSMREMMEKSREMLKTMDIKGISTELHATVSSPEVTPEDLQFELPESAVLKDSLFGSMMGGFQ